MSEDTIKLIEDFILKNLVTIITTVIAIIGVAKLIWDWVSSFT